MRLAARAAPPQLSAPQRAHSAARTQPAKRAAPAAGTTARASPSQSPSTAMTPTNEQPPPSEPPTSSDAVALLVADAMPKTEVGALEFLSKRGPRSDGRGVVVVVFDTGVDPACSGLRETTDGRPKMLDVRDCTGSGDVATTVVRRAEPLEGGEDGALYIESASGDKKMKINPSWPRCPTGEYRVGCKRLYELVPGHVKERVAADRRRAWEERHAAAVARAEEALAEAKRNAAGRKKKGGSTSSVDSSADDDEGARASSAPPSPPPSPSAKRNKKAVAEAEAALEVLASEASNYDDAGPWVECVVFRDEEGVWRGALDTSEAFHEPLVGAKPASDGRLETAPALASYRLEREHGVLSARSACSYALTVLDGGDVLEVCVDAGAHGSHCASIAAGHEGPSEARAALNGIAPGAQVISYKIGDSRFGSMETGTGLVRALTLTIAEARRNPHLSYVVNMSYGEATSVPDSGSFVRLVDEAVNVHGVHFVSSAGNAGPALGTVGAPGGTSSSIIAVGAYVSPAMAEAAHSLRSGLSTAAADGADAAGAAVDEAVPLSFGAQNYTWSSRGPTSDGDTGVVVSSPGAALACVPTSSRQSRQLMNGTSMASPCCAGCVALLLSGVAAAVADAEAGAAGSDPRLKGAPRPSPWRVRRALEATASPVGDAPSSPLTYGRGLVDVPRAFEYLLRDLAERTPDARYDVRVRRVGDGVGSQGGASGDAARGILIREPLDSTSRAGGGGPSVVAATVTVSPRLHEDADVATEAAVLEHALVLSSTQPEWVSHPRTLLLPHGGRSFEVAVDVGRLLSLASSEGDGVSDERAPGLFYAEVLATDAAAPWRGPLARVPITVVVPERVEAAAGGGDAVARFPGVKMTPGREIRRFLAAPEGSSWAVLRLKVPPASPGASAAPPQPRSFMLRLTQHAPQTRYSDTEARTFAGAVPPGGEATLAVAVRGGETVEATVGQFWSSHGAGPVDVEVAFHGIAVDGGSAVVLGPATPATQKVVVRAPIRHERLRPVAKLNGLRFSVRPKPGAAVVPLADDGSDAAFVDGGDAPAPSTGAPRGDTLPRGRRSHSLVLEYGLDCAEAGEYRVCVPLLTRMLYDSPAGVDSQLLMAYDANRKLVGCSDVYPSKLRLPKGKGATLRLRLRSRDPSALRALSDAALSVTRALEPAVSLPVYDSHEAAARGLVASASSPSSGGAKRGGNGAAADVDADVASPGEARERTLRPGERAALFVGPLPDSKVPKDAVPGSVLVGKLTLGRKAARDGGGDAPGSLPVSVVVPPKAKKGGGGSADDDDDEEDEGEEEKKKSLAEKRDEAASRAAVAFVRGLPLPGTASDERAAAEADVVIAEALKSHSVRSPPAAADDDGSDDGGSLSPPRPPLPLLAARVKALSGLSGEPRKARLRSLVDACDAVGAAVDVPALHAAAARALPDETPGHRRRAKELKKSKEALVEALLAKAQALAELSEEKEEEGRGDDVGTPPRFADEFDASVDELRAWVDDKDARAARLYSLREERAGRPAMALKLLDKALAAQAADASSSSGSSSGSSAPTAADAAARARLLDKLGFAHAAEAARGRARAAFPTDFALF